MSTIYDLATKLFIHGNGEKFCMGYQTLANLFSHVLSLNASGNGWTQSNPLPWDDEACFLSQCRCQGQKALLLFKFLSISQFFPYD
jgi:hypothetical protein